MSKSTVFAALGLALALAGIGGCSSSKKAAVYEHENFDDSGTFSRSFPVSEAGSCEAARRALLSQGYIITTSDKGQVNGNKSFQQSGETHLQISFNVVCADNSVGGGGLSSTMFANALQDRYALKKSNTSASLGVGVLGSVSMPIGSSDDSMVKVASETVTSSTFYERYFALVESFLPKPPKAPSKKAVEPEQPAADLGVPEPSAAPQAAAVAPEVPGPAPAPLAAPEEAPPPEPQAVPVAEAPAAPVVDDSKGSQPVAPPAEAAPITVQQEAPVESPIEAAAPAAL